MVEFRLFSINMTTKLTKGMHRRTIFLGALSSAIQFCKGSSSRISVSVVNVIVSDTRGKPFPALVET
jgi:hypothetical protein